MIKYIVLCFSILICTNSYSQIKNGKIEYTVKVAQDNTIDKKLMEEYAKDIEKENYTLTFDKVKSTFNFKGTLSENGNFIDPKIYYKDKDSLYLLRPVDDADFGKLVVIENRDTKWVITNETKKIGKYICHKATSILVRDNGKAGIFNFPITAWFTPEIPFSFGPIGYGGLPGMILELQEGNVLYGCTKIKFNLPTKKINIIKPSIGTRIKLEDYNIKIRSLFIN